MKYQNLVNSPVVASLWKPWRGLSIKSRLIRMQVTVTVAVLCACATGFLLNDYFLFRGAVARNADSVSGILGANLTAALVSRNHLAAQNILNTIRGEPSLVAASVFDAERRVVAQYGPPLPPESLVWPDSSDDRVSSFRGQEFVLSRRLMHGSNLAGFVALRANVHVLRQSYGSFTFVGMIVLAAGLLFSLMASTYNQRFLSVPIVRLVSLVRRITISGDYSLRLKSGRDEDLPTEIHALSEEFDHMLEQIQKRDRAVQLANELLERKVEERTAELKDAQEVAVRNAHAAGVAEIANGVLHNIGNIITSVTISAEEIRSCALRSKVTDLARAVQLLNGRLVGTPHLASDEHCLLLLRYFEELTGHLKSDQQRIEQESRELIDKAMLIRDVILMQQDYAKGNAFTESADLVKSIEDILKMQDASFRKYGITITKDFAAVGSVQMQRSKFAHVLINVLKNAREAMRETPPPDRELVLTIRPAEQDEVVLSIRDNGEGILPEHLPRIFNHGFTTKKDGHGFGMHFCANAMTEMGGQMTVASKGPGRGTCVSLRLKAASEPTKEIKR